MATLIQSYEQQYSVLTADITAKIGRLKVGNEGESFVFINHELVISFHDVINLRSIRTMLNTCNVVSDNHDQLTREINANFEEANDLVSYPIFIVYTIIYVFCPTRCTLSHKGIVIQYLNKHFSDRLFNCSVKLCNVENQVILC